MAPERRKLSLPAKLLKELGAQEPLEPQVRAGAARRPKGKPPSRKERRKAERSGDKTQRTVLRHEYAGHVRPHIIRGPRDAHHADRLLQTGKNDNRRGQQKPLNRAPRLNSKKSGEAGDDFATFDEASNEDARPRQDTVPKAVHDRLAEDDAEIAELECKLGLKGRKVLPKSFLDDGLADILGDPGDGSDDEVLEKKKRRVEDDAWLARKRRKSATLALPEPDSDGFDWSDEDNGDWGGGREDAINPDDPVSSPDSGEGEASHSVSDGDESEPDECDAFDASDADSVNDTPDLAPERLRENPYVAPTVGVTVAKYVPPSRRQEIGSDGELTPRIRRQAQGLINRLTESNMLGILGDIERLYRENARQHVTSILVDILLDQICDPTALPDTFLILTGGFATAVYRVVGTDFGAFLIQRTVDLFTEHYGRAQRAWAGGNDASKETSNLITFLSEIYNFQLIGCNLAFDYIRLLLETLTELNAELLLRIIRMCGPLLRQDDPLALKDIVTLIRPAITKTGEQNISVRTKFMIETINDLKNNRMRVGAVASALVSEHSTRMKKILGSLNARELKTTEPLRIGLRDVQDSDRKGKWWLVGASWSGNLTENGAKQANKGRKGSDGSEDDDDGEESVVLSHDDEGVPDLSTLAREQMMNTDVRRSIFVAIVSATDYEDAYGRLLKLRLSRDRQREIPNVLVQCAGAEQQHNPYYALIARRLCSDRKIRWAFQDSLWKLFRRLGEPIFGDGADGAEGKGEEEDTALDLRRLVNVAKMFGSLAAGETLSLGMLKCINLVYLQPKTKAFVEVMLITVLLEIARREKGGEKSSGYTDAMSDVFGAVAKGTPELARGIQWFLKTVVSKTDLISGKAEAEELRRAYRAADRVLTEALLSVEEEA